MNSQQDYRGYDKGVVHLTEQTFDEALAAAEGIWMVDFWAAWCGPCRAIAPVLEELAQTSKGGVTLAKVNVDEQPALAARYGIRSIPTILFVKDGKVADQLIGAVPKAQVQAKLTQLAGAGVKP
jgi:thioredoxin 1